MSRASLSERFAAVRRETERLAAPLSAEDQLMQAMPDASPTKWHRAHTTWFFETFVLAPHGVAACDPRGDMLWNSYYEALGRRHPRPKRGLLSRPSLEEVASYRRAVDDRMLSLLGRLDDGALAAIAPVVRLGIAHEEQHQELILTDILAAFAESPLSPAYAPAPRPERSAGVAASAPPGEFVRYEGGLTRVGAEAGAEFSFDNEGPIHRVFVEPFELAATPLTVGDVLAFAREGGYGSPAVWLSEGWSWVQAAGIDAPGYARIQDGAMLVQTLHGPRVASPDEPASHLSFYEADAIARFVGGRLPTEVEWEVAAASTGGVTDGQFRESGSLVPLGVRPGKAGGNTGLFGAVWEWTSSAYGPYPGFSATRDALGEYNGKFMIGQQVLRGGSCLSNRAHLRATYRNFWAPATRFQMTGARVARHGSEGKR